jgi:hypothetical protein
MSTPSWIPLVPVSGVGEDLGHSPVLWQHLGDETDDAALPGGLSQVLEQQLSDPPSLVRILHQECDLCVVVLDPIEASHRDHLVAERDDQCHPVDIVHLGEAGHILVAELGIRREEPEVLRLR